MNIFFTVFFLSVFLSFLFSTIVKSIALKFNIVDNPEIDRKIHKKAVPLLGGIACFLSFFAVLYFVKDYLLAGNLEERHWLGFLFGSFILIIGGFLDDKYNLRPSKQIIFPVLACISVIIGGVQIEKISSPFGGFINFSILLSNIVIFIWLMGMMYTTKLLDGLDGLVAGVTGIGSFIIFLFTISQKYYQPDISIAALILFGVCFGFLILNFNPAKIFLGEGGSLFLGFALGTLAIISGGKIAITLLVMGIPILDVFWTILRRLKERKNPFKFADRKHLHHRLYDLGLSQKKVVLIFYLLASVFGLTALFFQSRGKILVLSLLLVIMFLIILCVNYLENKKKI